MILQKFSYSLAAGETRKITARGRFIRGMASDSGYRIRIGNQQPVDFETGIAFESPEFFDQVELINSSASTQTIEVVIADGYVDDNRLVGQVNITGGLQIAGGSSINTGSVTVATSATLIKAATTGRRSLLIQANGADIWVGGSGVATSSGVKVMNGSSIEVTTTAAVYAIASGASTNARYLEDVNS